MRCPFLTALEQKTPPEFVACLKDPKQRALFHEFLKKNHSEENLEFWEAVQRYKAEDHNHERLAVYVLLVDVAPP